MLDHMFLTVSDIERSIAFYEAVLPHIGMTVRYDYDGKDGPAGHPDLKGFGADGRIPFWLKHGTPAPGAVHVGFIAHSEAEVRSAHEAALQAGAVNKITPGPQAYYDPRYYAGQVTDPDGYTLEFVYKPWQH